MPDTLTREPGSRSPTEIDKQVGRNIRTLRTEADMTLDEMGDALGISHQQLQKYETGTNRLSAGMLAAVARVLRVPIQSLFDEEPAASPFIPGNLRRSLEAAQRAIATALEGAAV
ncbi:MAG: helix-turn-helix transcriptional regulator [Acidobacteria bacterium]|nr:helix-turn-helix transcriptional regulator [Acidobacteriota bacterium]